MKPMPIKQVLLYQSIDVNKKQVTTLISGDDDRMVKRHGNYELFWIPGELHIKYNNGGIDIVPVGNIKKMTVDLSRVSKLCEQPKETPESTPKKRRRGRPKASSAKLSEDTTQSSTAAL